MPLSPSFCLCWDSLLPMNYTVSVTKDFPCRCTILFHCVQSGTGRREQGPAVTARPPCRRLRQGLDAPNKCPRRNAQSVKRSIPRGRVRDVTASFTRHRKLRRLPWSVLRKFLKETPTWAGDGTFKICPKLWTQAYTIHGIC